MAAARDGVGDLEGEFCGGPVALAALEGDGGCAFAKVGAGDGACCCLPAGCGSVIAGRGVLLVVVIVVGVLVVVRVISCVVGGIALSGITINSRIATSSRIALISGLLVVVGVVIGVIGIAIAAVCIVVIVVVVCGLVSTLGSTTSCSLGNNKVTQTSLVHEVKDTQAISGERASCGLLAQSGGGTVDIDSRVDEGSDTAKLRSGRERSVTADVLDIAIGEGVSVLLSSNKANGGGKSISSSTKFSEDLVGTGELCTLVYFQAHRERCIP